MIRLVSPPYGVTGFVSVCASFVSIDRIRKPLALDCFRCLGISVSIEAA